MKKLPQLICGALLCLGFTAANSACNFPYSDPTACLGTARTKVDGIKHVGYQISNLRREYVTEIGLSSNLVVVAYDASNPHAIDTLMPQLTPSRVKLALVVNSMFFDTKSNALADTAVTANIDTLYNKLAPHMANIHSLAVDEVVWGKHGNSIECDPATVSFVECITKTPSNSTIEWAVSNLERWSAMMRVKFPNTTFVYNESGPMTRTANYKLPKNWDLYGFDCYGDWNNCLHTGIGMSTLFTNLKKKVKALNSSYGGHRRMVVVGETTASFGRLNTRPNPVFGSWVGDTLVPSNPALGSSASTNDANLWSITQKWKNLAATDSMVNTFVGFLWDNLWEENVVWLGVRGYPYTRGQLEAWGRQVTSKPDSTMYVAPVIDFGATPNMKVNNGGPIWAWSTYNGSSCRSVSEPTAFQSLPASGALWLGPESAPRTFPYTIECSNAYGTTQKTITYSVSQ